MIKKGRTYRVECGSLYVTVLNIPYQTLNIIKAKLQLHYKNGIVVETKNYVLEREKIKHWIQVQ